MSEKNSNTKNTLLKRGERGNSWGHDRLITYRSYVSKFAAKCGIIALKAHEWDVSNIYPTKNHKVIASKKV